MYIKAQTAISVRNANSLPTWSDEVTVLTLQEGEESEVLQFLAERPLHTVAMAGFIRDNGMVSPHHRGKFYACRDNQGQLEGVALIGHSTLLECRTERALRAFANLAKACNRTHLIMGEEQRIAEFLKYYCDGGQQLRRACCEVLFEIRWPLHLPEDFTKLRLGTLRDLDLVAPVHAQMSWEESGVNPLESDPEGFRQRCSRRLQRNRTYVWIEGDVLLFKADVISETPEAAYIEGVWLHPSKSGNGEGLRCMTQLLKTLLARTESVCLLTNVENERAQNFYRKAGFKERGMYDSIFLKSSNSDISASTH